MSIIDAAIAFGIGLCALVVVIGMCEVLAPAASTLGHFLDEKLSRLLGYHK